MAQEYFYQTYITFIGFDMNVQESHKDVQLGHILIYNGQHKDYKGHIRMYRGHILIYNGPHKDYKGHIRKYKGHILIYKVPHKDYKDHIRMYKDPHKQETCLVLMPYCDRL